MNVTGKNSVKKIGARLCGLLLMLCMVVTAMLALSMDAYAATNDKLQLGKGGILSGDKVYFGKYTDEIGTFKIPWIVLQNDALSQTRVDKDPSTGTTPSVLPLLSEYCMGLSDFQESGSGYYSGSTLQTTIYNTIYNGFDSKEQAAVAATTLNRDSMYSSEQDLTGQKLFPISIDEASSLIWKSPILQAKSISTGTPMWWWVRSSKYHNFVFVVDSDGDFNDFHNQLVTMPCGVRPAFNLNLDSVLFTSAAAGGKISGAVGAGALTAVTKTGTSTNEWKLTIYDDSRAFTAGTTAYDSTNKKVTAIYSGATVYNATSAPNEYISAIIEGSDGSIKYYGRIAQPGSADGTVEIDLSGITLEMSDKLYVFSEQYNGGTNDDTKLTDYASRMSELPLSQNAYTITNTLTNVTSDNATGFRLSSDANDYTAKLKANTGYTLPANITVKVNGTALTAGADSYTYKQASGALAIKAAAIRGHIEIEAKGETSVTPTPTPGGSGGTGGGTTSVASDTVVERPDSFAIFLQKTIRQIASAGEGATITIDFEGFNVLTLPVMKQMALRRDLTIRMKYCYNAQKYEVTFPAGMPIHYQEDIRYYGPLKIADMANRDGGVCSIK